MSEYITSTELVEKYTLEGETIVENEEKMISGANEIIVK